MAKSKTSQSAGDTNKITPLHIYESLWRCRDFEISHLWQRSVFLTAFLVLAYTGYGFVLMKICDHIIEKAPKISQIGFRYLNIIGFMIALVGIILSILWIKMGKGSKAWYERYEDALTQIERDKDYVTTEVLVMNQRKCMHGALPEPEYMDNCLLSTNGGRFSPSRINICIGQLSLIVFTLASLGQMIFYGIIVSDFDICFCCESIVFFVNIVFVVLALIFCNKQCRSTSEKKRHKNREREDSGYTG